MLSALARVLGDELLEMRGDCDIGSVSMDSRKRMDRGLFFCVPGGAVIPTASTPRAA